MLRSGSGRSGAHELVVTEDGRSKTNTSFTLVSVMLRFVTRAGNSELLKRLPAVFYMV